jgi:Elongation factor G, domain IV
MLMEAYFDDSADEKRKKFYACGGLMGSPKQWDGFDMAWSNVTCNLEQPFRSADCEGGHGQFSAWSKPARDDLMRRLTNIIHATKLHGYVSVVPVPKYKKIFPEAKEHDAFLLGLRQSLISWSCHRFCSGGTAMNGSLSQTFHRETVMTSGVAGERVARQHEGTGVYAGIQVEVRPLARGKGTVFAWNAGANIPARFAAAVARGVQDAISAGVLARFELTDVLVSVEDGSYHEEDSSEAAFREVAQKATLAALRQAHPTILEAISICRATFPKEYASAIEESFSLEEGQIESAQSELQFSSFVVNFPTSRVELMVQQILSATNGQAKLSIESGGFGPKPEPPDAVNVRVPAT